jgi:hypothetical protein
MTRTLCQSAALDRIAPWVVMIAGLFDIIIKTILSMAENAGNSLHEPDVRCRKPGWRGIASSPDMAGLDDATGCVRLADLQAAPARTTETARVDRGVFLCSPDATGKVIGFEEC